MNSEFMQWTTRIIYYRRNTFKRRGIYSYFAAANINIFKVEKKYEGKTQMVDITYNDTALSIFSLIGNMIYQIWYIIQCR